MAKARRAKARPSRVVVPVLIALVAVAAVIGWQVLPRTTDAHAGSPASTVAAVPTASATTSATPTPSADSGAADRVAAALKGCRAKVADADAVLAAAKTGIGHWDEHVQAQTDANAGRITVERMDDIFARTRLAGPADQDRYRKALAAYDDAEGSCFAVAGAPAKDAATLAHCRARASAQHPVLTAAAPAMADWKSHLAAMARSRAHHMDDAEQIWVDAWRAAPPHLEAYAKAAGTYDPPDC